jgi:hypothetical protein
MRKVLAIRFARGPAAPGWQKTRPKAFALLIALFDNLAVIEQSEQNTAAFCVKPVRKPPFPNSPNT